MVLTIEKLKEVYAKKNYRFYEKGDYNINFFGIRSDNVLDNKFSDILGMAFYIKGKPQIILIPGTTCPGLYYGHAAMNPRPGGVAIIKPGQYIGVWKFIDSYTGWLNYPYFQQVGKFTIWRDGDKDTELDQVNEQEALGVGLNCHRMSNINQVALYVNNWSEGCQGANEDEFEKLLPATRECVKLYGFNLTYTLFEKSDF